MKGERGEGVGTLWDQINPATEKSSLSLPLTTLNYPYHA